MKFYILKKQSVIYRVGNCSFSVGSHVNILGASCFLKVILLSVQINNAGIEVGQQFFSRAEMVAVGFHSHWLNGIDSIGKSKGKVNITGKIENIYIYHWNFMDKYYVDKLFIHG
jgi:hypothetical protein